MRLLWLNANLLLPLDKGGRLRTWHLMRHLAARHEITYLCFAGPEDVERHGAEMSAVCARLETVPRRDAPKDSFRFYGRVARHLFDPAPYAVAAYRSGAYRRRLDKLLARGAFDRVVCDFLVPAINMPRVLPCPALLFTHNVEAEIWRRHAETCTNPIRAGAVLPAVAADAALRGPHAGALRPRAHRLGCGPAHVSPAVRR